MGMFRGTTFNDGDEMVCVGQCVGGCGKTYEMRVPLQNWIQRLAGGHIQDCFPDMPTEWREFLQSNTCPTCWNTIFGTDDPVNMPEYVREIGEYDEPSEPSPAGDDFVGFLRSLLPQPGN